MADTEEQRQKQEEKARKKGRSSPETRGIDKEKKAKKEDS